MHRKFLLSLVSFLVATPLFAQVRRTIDFGPAEQASHAFDGNGLMTPGGWEPRRSRLASEATTIGHDAARHGDESDIPLSNLVDLDVLHPMSPIAEHDDAPLVPVPVPVPVLLPPEFQRAESPTPTPRKRDTAGNLIVPDAPIKPAVRPLKRGREDEFSEELSGLDLGAPALPPQRRPRVRAFRRVSEASAPIARQTTPVPVGADPLILSTLQDFPPPES